MLLVPCRKRFRFDFAASDRNLSKLLRVLKPEIASRDARVMNIGKVPKMLLISAHHRIGSIPFAFGVVADAFVARLVVRAKHIDIA
jgi:hypothetical protein